MANEGFNTFISGLGAASTPFVGTEEFYVLQGTGSTVINYSTLVGLLFPAWTAFTPVISTTVGTLTSTGTVAGRFQRCGGTLSGKTVLVEIVGSITANGTGSGAITFTIPATIAGKLGITGDVPGICGRENGVSGKSLNTKWVTSTQISVVNYDNTYPGQTGAVIAIAGSYEAA
jgi:hypothetical protein